MAASTSEPDRRYPDRPFVAASLACFRDGAVLVASRTKPPAQALFSLPGGLVHAGETLAEAALRELREETGVEATVIGPAGQVEIIERDADGAVLHHFVVHAFAGLWQSGEPVDGPEAHEARFVDPATLADLRTTPGLADIVARAAGLVAAAEAAR